MKLSNANQPLDPIFLEFILRAFIRTKISPVWAKYIYLNEKAINPAFQTIEINEPLAPNDKRIFVLRSDLVLATGIKNAYQEHGYDGLQNAFDKKNHPFINWQDRYGHPSLATADSQFDGQVFYAGFICQRKDYLEVFLSSGRFNRESRLAENITSLSTKQTTILESYLALKFTQVFGKQPVRFYDTTSGKQDDEDSALFFKDQPFPAHKLCRVYSEKSILEAGKLALVGLNYTTAQNYINNNISSIKPPYKYGNEKNINPA